MRTTITLDDDVAAQIERLREERHSTLKQLVNEALRSGLAALDTPRPRSTPPTSPVSLGGPLLEIDDVSGALALVEGDARV